MADDLGWQDVGFMGSRWFQTPNLDKLAQESLVFTQAYMYPTCSPSRAALLTGKHSFKTGVYNVPVLEQGSPDDNIFSRWTVELEHDLYANPLRDADYKLIHLGKWHIVGPYPEAETGFPLSQPLVQPASGDMSWLEHHKSEEIQKYYPVARGFHENIGGTWWGDPARGHAEGYQTPGGGYVAPFNNPFIEDKEDGVWLTDRLTSEAIKFIGRNQDHPFFVNLHFYAPHRPTAQRNTKWFQYFMNKPGDEISGQGIERREEMAAYATMFKSIDENVQRIVDCLEERGLRRKTVVIFTSDTVAIRECASVACPIWKVRPYSDKNRDADVDVETKRRQLLQRVEEDFPSKIGSFRKAYAGSLSTAVKAMCLECVQGVTRDIHDCSGTACPLMAYRPYQRDGGEHEPNVTGRLKCTTCGRFKVYHPRGFISRLFPPDCQPGFPACFVAGSFAL